jgi:hypothetical protein
MVKSPDVSSHYSHEFPRFDPWSVTASRLPAGTTRLARLPGARHTIFRDRPDRAFPAVRNFVSQI